MDGTLKNQIRKRLCHDGIWELTNVMKSVLTVQISRLPAREVAEMEIRYPTTPAGMRAFLVLFFTRHYFQIQHSLLDYMTSYEFLQLLTSGELQILDVGCGPAVASLAITDTLGCILEHLKDLGSWPRRRVLKVTYVLNDTSGVCLGTGQRMLMDYFHIGRGHCRQVVHGQTISVKKPFPDNMNQLRRVTFNLGMYDIAALSYVISPLNKDAGIDNLVSGLLDIGNLCNRNGRMLIVQDQFQAALMRQISRALGVSNHKEELTQEIYPNRNTNETYTYSYYSCLYAPIEKVRVRQSAVS